MSDSQLAETLKAAMEIWDAQKAQGVSLADRTQALETSLRLAWPSARSEPWHYYCDRCSDTGWESRVCSPSASCGRPFKLPKQGGDDFTGQGHCPDGHDYVVPCWCTKGQAHRRLLLKQAASDDAELTQIGRTKSPTRLGR